MTSLSTTTGTYSVITGTDIISMFNDQILANMQAVSYSITRQKAPIYCMGDTNPKGIARSKRGIAGSLIMTTFDRHVLSDFMAASRFSAKKDSIVLTKVNPYYNGNVGTSYGRDLLTQQNPGDTVTLASAPDSSLATNTIAKSAPPMFTDELLPFDITLMGSNEYGVQSMMRVFGVEILNEGSGYSIDDTSNEVQFTYIARLVSPWIPQAAVEVSAGQVR